jgi:hypothetical protein
MTDPTKDHARTSPHGRAMSNPIRIFKLDDYDWWAGESLAACIDEARRQCGAGSYCDAEDEGRELTADEMQAPVCLDDPQGGARTFAELLEREIADGTHFPCLIASAEW